MIFLCVGSWAAIASVMITTLMTGIHIKQNWLIQDFIVLNIQIIKLIIIIIIVVIVVVVIVVIIVVVIIREIFIVVVIIILPFFVVVVVVVVVESRAAWSCCRVRTEC